MKFGRPTPTVPTPTVVVYHPLYERGVRYAPTFQALGLDTDWTDVPAPLRPEPRDCHTFVPVLSVARLLGY